VNGSIGLASPLASSGSSIWSTGSGARPRDARSCRFPRRLALRVEAVETTRSSPIPGPLLTSRSA